MTRFLSCLLVTVLALPAFASVKSKPQPSAASKPAVAAAQTPAPAPTPVAIPPAPAAPTLTLDAYIADLAAQLPLSKDEQTAIKAYYQDDGAKLQAVLADASLSPLEQQRQIDDLRNTRNGTIEALLKDVDRQAKFLQLERSYRVALVELAATGGLVATAPVPKVPEPTATPAAQADKTAPGM